MSKFGILLKLKMNEQFRFSATKNEKNPLRKSLSILRMFFLLLMFACVFYGLYFFNQKIAAAGYFQILPVLAYVLSSIVTLIVTILKIHDLITDNTDSEFLLALPISSGLQVLAVFFVLFLENFVFCCLMEVPSLLVYINYIEPTTKFYCYWTLGLFMTSLPASGVAALIGVVLTLCLITSPKSNQIHSGISIVALCGASILMLYIFFSLGNLMLTSEGNISETIALMTKSLVSNYKLANFYVKGIMAQCGPWSFMFVFISVIWYLFFVLIFIIGYKIIISSLKTPKSYTVYEWKEQKQTQIKKMLFQREIHQFFRSKSYFKTSFFMYLLAIIISVGILIEGVDRLCRICNFSVPLFAVPFMLCIFISLGNTTYCSLTIEGKRNWIIQTMPFDKKLIYAQKIKLNLLLSLPTSLICGILLIIAFKPGILLGIAYVLIPVIWSFLTAIYGMWIDSKFADYSLGTERLAMHGSVSFFPGYLLPLLICCAVFIILMLI